MGGEWIECRLADVCDSIDYGLTASASEQHSGPRFLRITDIVQGHVDWKTVPGVEADKEAVKKYSLCHGDIVIARTGASTGASALITNPPPAVFASYLVRLKIKPSCDFKFIAYYLKSSLFLNFINGVLGDKSAQPNASASTMTRAPIRMKRDLRAQRAISEILSALDDRIELNRRMAETLEAMARALFKSWFVDFDPVHAHAERRLTGLPDDLAALFPESFDDDGLPKGWHTQPLSKFGELDRATCSPSEFGVASVSHFSIPAFDVGRQPILETASNIKSLKLRLKTPVVLFSKLNPGTPRIWPVASTADRPALASTEYLAFRSIQHGVSFTYLALLLSSSPLVTRAASMVTGTSKSHQRVQAESLLATTWPMPPRNIVSWCDMVTEPLLSRADTARNQCETLVELRDTLLPKLISGELRIADAEQCVAAA